MRTCRDGVAPMSERLQGQCPMGCGDTLFVGSDGYVTCSWHKCPNPSAVADLLLDHAIPNHIVVLGPTAFHILHPLRERLLGELFDCPLHEHLNTLSGPPRQIGRYRVIELAAVQAAEAERLLDRAFGAAPAPWPVGPEWSEADPVSPHGLRRLSADEFAALAAIDAAIVARGV